MKSASRQDIVDTARTHLSFLTDPALAENLSLDTGSFAECQQEVTTYYVMLPYPVLSVTGKFFRLILASCLGELLDPSNPASVRTMVVCDEYFQVVGEGGLPDMAHAFSAARKFRTQFHICVGSLGELKNAHPHSYGDLLAHSGVVQWLQGARDVEGSEYLSKMCGEREVHGYGKNVSSSLGYSGNELSVEALKRMSVTENRSQHSRRLLLPHEAAYAIGRDEEIAFVDGIPGPLRLNMKSYLDIPEMKAVARPNRFYREQSNA